MAGKMRRLFPVVLGAAISTPALAQAHAGDVILKYDGVRIITGRTEGTQIVYGGRVFSGTLGDLGVPNATFSPGYDSESGAFTAGTTIGITIRKALRTWDGQDFDEISDELVRITKGQNNIVTPEQDPPTCEVGGSLILGLASITGILHQHPAYELLAPADPGVYLLELEAWMGAPGNAASLPFWIVFNQDSPPATVEAAFQFADFILTCPADFNRSGSLTVADFVAFQSGFVTQDPRADFNLSCSFTVADFIAFQSAFVAGCP